MNKLLWRFYHFENLKCQKIFSPALLVLGVMLHSVISIFTECSIHIWEYMKKEGYSSMLVIML